MAADVPPEVLEELYRSPPERFVRSREAAVREARQAGDRELARAIHELRRPTRAAWLANLLAYDRCPELDELLDLAGALREAQGQLRGDALRELSAQRQRVVAGLVATARRLAAEAGEPVRDDTADDLEATLNAALADPDTAAALRSGRLTSAQEYSGFGLDGGSTPVATAKPRTERREAPARGGRRKQQEEREQQEQQERQRLERAWREAQEQADAAEAELGAAEQAAADAQVSLDGAEEDVRRLTAELEEADRRRTQAQHQVQERRHERRAASQRAETARRRAQRAHDRMSER